MSFMLRLLDNNESDCEQATIKVNKDKVNAYRSKFPKTGALKLFFVWQ